MSNKILLSSVNPLVVLLFVILLVGIGGVGGYFFGGGKLPVASDGGCTMDAKICPDGSAVGREGPKCEFAACPATQPGSNPTTVPTKILSTPTPIAKTLIIITPMSTQGWKSVENDSVKFKIPENAKCNSETMCSEVTFPNIYQGKEMPIPARVWINVTNYGGGSRREQYLQSHPQDKECRPIFVESKFSNVSALQIAVDGGWCQGGYVGSIVSVIGKKFVSIGPGLNYDSNKQISRWAVRDTLVSTLRAN